MKFSALRDFVAVVERGSLRAAARHQGAAQPAISRNIRELERKLGVVLFERSAKGAQLTPLGKVFYQRAKAVQTELRRAQEELDQLRGESHGQVTVALSTVAQVSMLPEALRPFRKKYPEVKLDIVDGLFPRIEAELKSGAIDCYIGPIPAGIGAEFSVEKLFDNTRVVAGRKGHPLAKARTLEDLAGAEWVTTSLTPRAEAELGPLFTESGLPPPRTMLQVHSALTLMVALVSSDLLALLPVQWPRAPGWRDLVQVIPLKSPLAAPAINIVQRSALPLTPAAEYFCDLMRRAAGHLR